MNNKSSKIDEASKRKSFPYNRYRSLGPELTPLEFCRVLWHQKTRISTM